MAISGLQMQRGWIMHSVTNLPLFKFRSHLGAVVYTNRIQVIYMPGVICFERRYHAFHLIKPGRVTCGVIAPQLIASFERAQFDYKTGRLDCIHAAIPADHGMVILLYLAMIAKN